MYANIIVDISQERVDKTFQYHIPDDLLDRIHVGTQVVIPFGNGRSTRKGYVVGITPDADLDPDKIKDIRSVASGSVSARSHLIELAWWMKERYGSTMNQALKTVLPVKREVKHRESPYLNSILNSDHQDEDIVLNEEQKAIISDFIERYDSGIRETSLIYGITGSGKTAVYMEMIEHVLSCKRQVIVLIPEIALTYQTVRWFCSRFKGKVALIHSRMSAGERYDQFEKARNGDVSIMIGPRSALFTPFSTLGLIIIDEEHEGAYKSETSPRYDAREVAAHLAEMTGADLVLGSATPSLESYTQAKNGNYRLYRLTKRAKSDSHMADVRIVDLREEMRMGNRSIFSRALEEAIEDQLSQKKQIMLFLNRRGYANFVSCRSCGEALKCPHCDVTLTLHGSDRLICHYCGYQTSVPRTCPSCGSPYIAGFGTGTQKIEAMTKKMFPEARVLRMDLDTTGRKGSHQDILRAFAEGEADILVGTQMIVKGHDFPNVTLVGVLAADLSLNSPDYRCAERTFQLLTQAAGRAGRDRSPGEVIIQTYRPDHYSIQCAARQDYETFYEHEMAFRRALHYPPVTGLLSVMLSSADEEALTKASEKLKDEIEITDENGDIELIGPASAPVYKVKDIYRKILYLKHQNYDILIQIKDRLEDIMKEDPDFTDISVHYDLS